MTKMIRQVCMILLLASSVASQTCSGPAALNCSAPTPCCSSSYSCGNTTTHCGVGCLARYSAPRACLSSKELSWATTIAASEPRCGRDPTDISKDYGKCKVLDYCCSPFGYCGVGDNHCIGCHQGFGRCPTLCDGSKPCGTYGIVSFVFSCIAGGVALLALCIQGFQAWAAWKASRNPPLVRSPNICSPNILSNLCNRH